MSEAAASHDRIWELMEVERPINKEALEKHFVHHLQYSVGKHRFNTQKYDIYKALGLTIRDLMVDRLNETQHNYRIKNPKRVYYLSLEFLIGRTLGNALINLGIDNLVEEMLTSMGFDLNEIMECEADAGLGNGGLGRLAACFMDSMATLNLPGYGYGIRYDYGIFNQHIHASDHTGGHKFIVRKGARNGFYKTITTSIVQLLVKIQGPVTL